ncbi:MAG: trigger factor [Bacteroidota bacterium]|nr:trigger factor [Bacteroidota bacterium]
MAEVTRENIGLLHDKLTVKLSKDDYYPSFEKSIKEYSKKANIPGFRKGMVPAGMVKKMYGASVFYDAVIKEVEKEIQNYLTNEKPDFFAQPLPMKTDLRNLDMNNPEDYEFPFEIGLKPKVDVDLAKANLTFHKVKVTEEMINEEIERLQNRHGKMLDPETVTSEENVLNVNFVEVDAEGTPVPDGVSKDNSLLVKYFTPAFREQLIGKKKDDSIVLQLNNAFEEKEREWIIGDLGLNKEDTSAGDKHFKMIITKVGLVEKRELNEEFFNEVFPGKEIKTEEEFRNELRNEIQKHWDVQSRVQLHDQLYHFLLDTPIQFPDEFLKRWLQRGSEKEKSEDEVEAEFPSFINQLKWTLLSDKFIKENNLEVSQEELRENMKKEILQYFGQMKMDGDTSWIESYIDRMMKDEKQIDASYRRLITDKLFSWAESQVKPEEKEVTSEELTAMQHNHHH